MSQRPRAVQRTHEPPQCLRVGFGPQSTRDPLAVLIAGHRWSGDAEHLRHFGLGDLQLLAELTRDGWARKPFAGNTRGNEIFDGS